MANISENAILSYCSVTVGSNTYYFQSSSVYKVASIAAATGITYIAAKDFKGTEPLVQIEQLIRAGVLVRLNALVANPVDGKKNKTSQLLCDFDLLKTARTDLPGKTLQIVKGTQTIVIGKILKIRGKTRDRFS
jgi:hypothetical protein